MEELTHKPYLLKVAKEGDFYLARMTSSKIKGGVEWSITSYPEFAYKAKTVEDAANSYNEMKRMSGFISKSNCELVKYELLVEAHSYALTPEKRAHKNLISDSDVELFNKLVENDNKE